MVAILLQLNLKNYKFCQSVACLISFLMLGGLPLSHLLNVITRLLILGYIMSGICVDGRWK